MRTSDSSEFFWDWALATLVCNGVFDSQWHLSIQFYTAKIIKREFLIFGLRSNRIQIPVQIPVFNFFRETRHLSIFHAKDIVTKSFIENILGH